MGAYKLLVSFHLHAGLHVMFRCLLMETKQKHLMSCYTVQDAFRQLTCQAAANDPLGSMLSMPICVYSSAPAVASRRSVPKPGKLGVVYTQLWQQSKA